MLVNATIDCRELVPLRAEGVEQRWEPPPLFAGDVYAARKELPLVPLSLEAALHAWGKSEFARRALGADVVKHYAHFFDTENKAFAAAVTDWERRRYFEQV